MKYPQFEHVRQQLYAAVVCDILDSLGHRQQSLAPQIRPLDDGLKLFGRVRTGLYAPVYHIAEDLNPYEMEIDLIDSLEPGDVPVFACPQNERVVPWGELLSTSARARGASGCVTDGLVRDVHMMREMRFPVFASGARPLDSKGRGTIIEIDTPVECGGVRTQPGDYLFGDVDGVVIIPEPLADEVIGRALEKVAGENTVRAELAQGHKLRDVFTRHGIL